MLLEVRGLNAYYGKSHILQGVDFGVGAGEIVALLGRNGVGRSTTCKAIMGLVPPVPFDQTATSRRCCTRYSAVPSSFATATSRTSPLQLWFKPDMSIAELMAVPSEARIRRR